MIALILLVLILLVSLCLLQRYTKQVAEAQGVEISLRNSLRQVDYIQIRLYNTNYKSLTSIIKKLGFTVFHFYLHLILQKML